MKTRKMKMKFHRALCTIMAVIFVMGDIVPAVSAQGTGAASADTKQVIGFESVNPVEYYELEYGGTYEELEIPDKIRVVTELPEDLQLSAFEESEAPEQQDELLPKYEYSHTVDKLMLETANEASSSDNTSSQITEEAASQAAEETVSQGEESAASPKAAEDAGASGGSVEVSAEEAQVLLEESSKISHNDAQVYSFTDDMGKAHYRVYGSVNGQEPCWWAVDKEGTVLGVVEELDANWDFSKLDSTVAGEYQVKVQLPENYILNQGVEIAYMQIMVAQENGTQVTLEQKDSSLPSVLPVSYIASRSAANNTQATYPVTIEKEGSTTTESLTFAGGDITKDSVPAVTNYFFIEEKDGTGAVTSNGASLRVTIDGVMQSYNNVTAIYPVTQDDDSVKWFYTTTLSDSRVAWEVPTGAQLVFRYEPDPNANVFTRVTIESNDWKDGSATGYYGDDNSQKNYTALVPAGEQISVTVDLPSLYSAYQSNISYTNIAANQVTQSNTRTQLNSQWGPSNTRGKWINDTVTFTFTVPALTGDQAREGVKIKLKFLSYMREYFDSQTGGTKQSANETLWLRINQDYPTLSPYVGKGTPKWLGQRAIRIFEATGRKEFRYNSNGGGAQVEQNPGTGTYISSSKTAYQNLGPEALMTDMSVANSNWKNIDSNDTTDSKEMQTYWSTHSNDDSVQSMQNGAYMMYIMNSSNKRASKEIAADSNDERTLFFIYQNTLRNMLPTYDGASSSGGAVSGQDLPIGVMLYTQNHSTGIFVPLEAELSMTDMSANGGHKVMAEVEIAGMTIKVTRENYSISNYTTNLGNVYPTAKVRNWIYTVQVQGSTGFLAADFITAVDTQNSVSLSSVSPNVANTQVLATTSGDPYGNDLVWQPVDSGISFIVYQLGANKGGKFSNFYNGGWSISYYDREGGFPIRVEQKEGYGIPYLKFIDNAVSDEKKLIAAATNLTVDSNGYGTVNVTNINGQSNKPVQSRRHDMSSTGGSENTFEFLFGYRRSNSTWDGWGKSTKFTIEADAKLLALTYNTNGGTVSGGSIPTNTTTWGSGYYITVPSAYPAAPAGSGYFLGWRIKLADNSYLKDAEGNDIYLQPNQTINTTDERYFPQDKLAIGHGVDYQNTGYYNVSVVNLEAAYSTNIPDGAMISGKIKTFTQNKAGVGSQESEYTSSYTEQSGEEKAGNAPYGGNYYVNMPETYQLDGDTYLLNEGLSKTSGVADTTDIANFVLANGRYDKAVTVTYDVGDDWPQNAHPTAPTDSNQYTTVNGHQNSIDLQNPDGTYEEGDFNGWTLKYTNGSISIPKEIDTLVLDGNQSGNSTVGNTMTIGGSAAEAIYTSGEVNLTAVWNTMLPIISARTDSDSTTADDKYDQYKQPDVAQFYSGTDMIMEGQFKYDHATKALILAQWGTNGSEKTDSKAPDAMAQYLDWSLYGVSMVDGNNPPNSGNEKQALSLRGSNEFGLTGVKTKLQLDDDVDGTGYATATITITIPGSNVTYEKLKNQVFYLFAWNDATNSELGTSYTSTTSTTDENSPGRLIFANEPGNDLSMGNSYLPSAAIASEFKMYKNMVARGITTTEDDMAVVTGDEIQWKNIDAQTQTFEVDFKYDTSIPWSAQSAEYSSADTSDTNAIRVVLAKKVGNGTWEELQRFNPDGTFGNDGDLDNYDIELVQPASDSDTFKVKVTAKNSVMEASADNDDTEFMVVAYNFQNGETGAPAASTYTKMSEIVGHLDDNSVIGTKVPAVKRSVKIYPKGVKITDDSNTETLSQEVAIEKDYYQPSAEQTVLFTFDNAGYPDNYQSNTDFQNRFSPTGDNYHVALYKQESGNWNLVESDDTAENSRKYITAITPSDNGQVTVKYKIPAEENTQDTKYRLMAWYGDIDGNNNIQANAITPTNASTVMDNVSNLATVNITLNPVNTFTKVEMSDDNRPNGADVWNDQKKFDVKRVQPNAEDVVMTATLKYDVSSKDIIENYWNNREDTATTDDGMGRYLNWVMYGYNTRTQQHSTWVIREQNVTGGSNNVSQVDGLTVDLNLGDNGIATITITIPAASVTYDLLENQYLFLFAWNDASQSFTDRSYKLVTTNYKALMHTDTSSDSSIYKSILQRKFNEGNVDGGLGGLSAEWQKVGTLPNYRWNFRVIPGPVTQTNNTTGDATTPTQVLDNRDKASQELKSVTFKYDDSVPWDVQNNSGSLGQQVLRVAAYKQDYPASEPGKEQTGNWKLIAHHNGNGTVSNASGYSLNVVDNKDSTFTVTLTAANGSLAANYANYDSRIKIVAYNTQNNYSGNTANLLETGGQLNTLIGSQIPSNTTSVQMNPAPMESVGHGGVGDTTTGTIGHHAFTFNKMTDEENAIVSFKFQGDPDQHAVGTNPQNPDDINDGMEDKFALTGSNVVFSLWKKESNSQQFEIAGYYTNSKYVPVGTAADEIRSVGYPSKDDDPTQVDTTSGIIEVDVAVDPATNTQGTQFRVYAWYVSSNSQNWSSSEDDIKNAVFAEVTPGDTVEGVVPYSTATMLVDYQAPETYIYIPDLVTLYDDEGNVKDDTGDDVSDQYAGAGTEISYETAYLPGSGSAAPATAPEIQVEITDNMPMTKEGATTPSNEHSVGVYFTDGYKNNKQGENTGMVMLGLLSQTQSQTQDGSRQITPIGNTLPFYLNTKQGHNGEKYTVKLEFHFIIKSSSSTTP